MSVLLIVCLLIYPANSGALVGITGSGNFSFPPLRLATSGHSVVALKRTHNDTYTPTSWKAIAIKRKPRVVAGSLAAQWGALSWDLQKMSESRWTALYDVLALPRKLKTKVCDQASEPSFEGSIFYVHNSMGESEAIRPSASGSSAQEPQIVREMSLRAFLASAAVAADSNAGLAHQKITKKDKQYSYLFSTEYTVLEDELQVWTYSSVLHPVSESILVMKLFCFTLTAARRHIVERLAHSRRGLPGGGGRGLPSRRDGG